MKRLPAVMLGMILATASTPGFAQQPAHQPPTAAELFALHERLERLTTCAQLAKKILDTHGGHGADWRDPVVSLRYDPATDHCYVEMVLVGVAGSSKSDIDRTLPDSSTAGNEIRISPDLGQPIWGGLTQEVLAATTVYTTLWDGQTQELLATTTISQNGQRRFGTVFANDPNYKHRLPSADNGYGFDDANNYINRLMYENR